jgi:hypothetical protein
MVLGSGSSPPQREVYSNLIALICSRHRSALLPACWTDRFRQPHPVEPVPSLGITKSFMDLPPATSSRTQ